MQNHKAGGSVELLCCVGSVGTGSVRERLARKQVLLYDAEVDSSNSGLFIIYDLS